ncbi:MAG TPA: hypothetical protein P5556_07465 [Candidatus Gastranaerophilales bacterium]|nr:hypothetical protein [Candidatus Gastranaerophilales bacterium]
MKTLKYFIFIAFLFFLISFKAYSQVFSFEATADDTIATFPKGTMLKAILQETVSTKDNQIGDRVSFVTVSDLTIGKATCIPKDSILLGQVIRLEKAKEGRDGYFQLSVNEIIFPDGWRTTLSATLWTADGMGIIGGAVTQMQEYKKIAHYIEDIGPVVQLVKTGARAMGQERAMLAGNNVIIVLEQQLQVKYLEKFE